MRCLLRHDGQHEPIVITGIGMVASVGAGREAVWQAVREGRSGARKLNGLHGIPDGLLIGAPVEIEPDCEGQLKVITMARQAAGEAIDDAGLNWTNVDSHRFGCAISGHMGDTGAVPKRLNMIDRTEDSVPYWQQWMPNSACSYVANHYHLYGPRLSHCTACASGLIDIMSGVRAIQDDQCDVVLAGSSDGITSIMAAGFRNMGVLAEADDPTQACRPFDASRNGFLMGEGAAMFVIERLSHARQRNAPVYAEIVSGKLLADAHHMTGIDMSSEALEYLIRNALKNGSVDAAEIGYVNAHGTGTQQNDVAETRGIKRALGEAASRQLCMSSNKAGLGHLVNAAGSVELAITTLALRDGFMPPTLNLHKQDPACDLDCIPLVGRKRDVQSALKLSVAFGGHLAAVVLRKWDERKAAGELPARRAA